MAYIRNHEIQPGMLIWLAHSSTTPSRVTEVGEASHGLASAYGALAITVETYSLSEGHWLSPRRVSAWPDQTFRVEDKPEIWEG